MPCLDAYANAAFRRVGIHALRWIDLLERIHRRGVEKRKSNCGCQIETREIAAVGAIDRYRQVGRAGAGHGLLRAPVIGACLVEKHRRNAAHLEVAGRFARHAA